MAMDPETAALLREVAQRKEAAVAGEDFDLVSAAKWRSRGGMRARAWRAGSL